MYSLGIDLASNPDRTGYARIDWRADRCRVETLGVGADDDRLFELQAGCRAVGIDAPFGWPEAFTAFVATHARPGASAKPDWTDDNRRALRFRETDRVARRITRRWPLSVSSDLIAVPAFRCIGLLARLGVLDRGGDGRVYEAYPALALARWGLPDVGYKGKARLDRRTAIVDAFCARCDWLAVSDADRALMYRSDDALDALITAVIARVAWLGDHAPDGTASWVVSAEPDQRRLARREGWIVIPAEDALERLGRPPA